MFRNALALLLATFSVLLCTPAFASVSVSPTTITTGLRWDSVSGGLYSYTGTPLTVSGNSGPVTWTIDDQSGTTITTLSTGGGTSPAGLFGQVDCKGSSSNTACVYNAPSEYPSGETAALVASDGSSSATVAVTFAFADNLQEYWKHRARMLGFNAKPASDLAVASNPTRYQPELLVFQPPPLSGLGAFEYQIAQNDNDVSGAGFPATAGSMINRPSWTYDGKWFSWDGRRCTPDVWCSIGDDSKWIAQSDGSNLQRILPGLIPGGFSYTYGYNKPNWLITSDASNLYVVDLANSSTRTGVATYSGSNQRQLYSQVTGSKVQFKEPNLASCQPISPSCSSNIYIYDFSACEGGLGPSCATLSSQWNLNLSLTFGWDEYGNQHCTIDGGGFNCEYHAHDLYFQRHTTNTVWLYGPFSTTGESIAYRTSANGTGTVALYPNTANNVPYMSHPAFNGSGQLVAYEGRQYCTPSGNTCTDNNWGEGVWNLQTNKSVAFSTGVSYGHGAWDGFDNNHFAHDGYGGGSCLPSHWCLQSSLINYTLGTITDTPVLDFGTRDEDSNGNHSFTLLYSPTQSADATKIAESMETSFSAANQSLGWVAVVQYPYPPVRISLASSSAATLGWYAHPLNHEAKAYHVYKQPSCGGPWVRLADVNAVYLQQTQYTYTDTGLPSGEYACYGVSTEEWSGIEGNTLSTVIKITNTSGTFTATTQRGSGTIGFDTTAPGAPSGFTAALARINTPSAPASVSQGTGGTLLDGTYWVRVAYCNFADFPANTTTNAKCTGTSPAQSVSVSGGLQRASLSITTAISDMYGQIAIQIYAGGPSPTEPAETLQTCSGLSSTYILPWPPTGWPGQTSCVLTSIVSGAAPPAANQTVLGYNLAWTPPGDDDVRYYAIYSRDDAAPPLASANAYTAQQYLIATVPAGYASYLDYTVNWTRAYSGSGGPYYGIVAVDRLGNRSPGVCLNAATGASVTCD